MTNKIFGVERDVVLMSLYSYKTNLILSLKDEQPKIILNNSYGIPAQNVIFIQKNIFLTVFPKYENNSEITVCFFYQGRGIFFKTVPKETQNGYGLIIPQVLYKQQDKTEKKEYDVSGKLFYTGKEEKGRFISCYSNPKYPLFTPFLWHYFSETDYNSAEKILKHIAKLEKCEKNQLLENLFAKEKKILYIPEGKISKKNYFPYEATFISSDFEENRNLFFEKEVYIPLFHKDIENSPCTICSIIQDSVTISPLEIEDSITALPICKFLVSKAENIDSIQGRAVPLDILYLNDNSIILGLKKGTFPLQKGSEYPISLFVTLPIGKREIFITMYVSRVYESSSFFASDNSFDSNKTIAVCRFTSIKEEDRRFLFEKLYKKVFV